MGNAVDLKTWRGRLKTARIRAGFSGPELSDRLGKSRNWAYATEKGAGSPDPDTLVVLAGILGCTVGWLVTGNESGRTEFVDQMAAMEPQLDSIGLRTVIGVARLQVEEAALRREATTLSDEEVELLRLVRTVEGPHRQELLASMTALARGSSRLGAQSETASEADPPIFRTAEERPA